MPASGFEPMGWDELDPEERWGELTLSGRNWLQEADPGRYYDLQESRTNSVKIISEIGELYEIQFRNSAIVHIAKDFVEVH